jgi:hypothetical protein
VHHSFFGDHATRHGVGIHTIGTASVVDGPAKPKFELSIDFIASEKFAKETKPDEQRDHSSRQLLECIADPKLVSLLVGKRMPRIVVKIERQVKLNI